MAIRVRVGATEIVGLVDRTHQIDPAWHYPTVPALDWEPYRDLVADEVMGLLNFRGFLVRADGRTILIDTGWGPDFAPPGAPATPARLLDELAEADATPPDVDLVVLSHLHADHVGWNLITDADGVRPRFQNARYMVPRADWDHYSARDEVHPNIRQNALPLGGLGVLDLYDGETVISPALVSLPTPGHTPGHMSFVLRDGDDEVFVLGDLAHHPVIAIEETWVHRFDWDPDQAIATRRAILERLERDETLVGAGHFPAPGFGRFVRVDGQRRWQPLDVSADA